ncbi:MAG: hypothetical protein RIB61_01570 [Roseicyclus sp.]
MTFPRTIAAGSTAAPVATSEYPKDIAEIVVSMNGSFRKIATSWSTTKKK